MLRLILKVALAVTLLSLALSTAAATVHLAVVGDFSGQLTIPEAVWAGQVVGGVLGAIGERAAAVAADGAALDPNVQLLTINVTTAASLGTAAVQSQVASTLASAPTVVAVLAPARGAAAEGSVAACVAAGVPVVGPETTNQSHYVGATPGSNGSAVIHWRPDAVTEAVAQLRFLTHGQARVRLTLLAFRPPFEAAAAAVLSGLTAMGLPPPVTVNLTTVPSAAVAAKVAGAYATAAKTPHGIMLLLDNPADVVAAVLGVVGAGGLPNTTFFTAPSFATLPLWKYPINGAWTALPFATLFHASSIPHYADSRFVFASKFRAAARTYGGVAGAVPSLAGISGYAAARLVLAAVDRVPRRVANTTGPVVLRTLYELETVRLDDWQVGPFAAGCTGYQRPDGDACSCNSGGRVVFTTRVNETTGLTEPWRETSGSTFNSAEVLVPPSKCGIDPPTILKTPHIQVSFFDDSVPQPTLEVQYFSLFFATTLLDANYAANTVRKHLYSLSEVVRNISRARIGQLADRYSIFLMVAASSVDMRAAMITPALPLLAFAESRFTYYDADPDTMPYDQWNPNFIPLMPTLADFAHTAAAYAVNLGRGGSIHILADTDVLASLARRSVETLAGASPASVRVVNAQKNVTAQSVYPPQGGSAGTFIMVVSQNPLLLRAAQKAALELMPGGAIFVLCSSEFVLARALEPTAAVATNVMFTSGLPTFTAEGARGNPIYSYGAVIARFVVAFTNLDTGTRSTAQASIDALYDVGSLSASTISVGPLSKIDCGLTTPSSVRPAGQCQCSKGLTTFHIRNLTSWAITLGAAVLGSPVVPSDGSPLFTFRLPDCGVRYVALPPEETGLRGTALLLTVTGSTVAAVAIVGVVAFAFYYFCVVRVTIRDTSAAPKDASQPFAMVFTDIQASTTLWAHAPHAMGPALDTHHSLLRRLIEEYKGYEVKTIGDSFMVAFNDLPLAIDFALAVQGSLYEYDWGTGVLDSTYRQLGFGAVPDGCTAPPTVDEQPEYDSLWNGLRVRVGVHYGMGDIKFDETSKGYDYYGTVVNTAARVEGVGHGGQIIVTEDSINRLATLGMEIPPCCVVLDLGPQRLRGLSEPVHLTQLLPEALAARSFPPLRLDIEIDVEEEATNMAATGPTPGRDPTLEPQQDHPSDGESSSNALEAVATRLACGNVQSTPQAVLFAHEVLHRAVAPLPQKEQLSFAKRIAGAWRVPAEPPFTGALRRSARSLPPQELLMVQVAARALQAATSVSNFFTNTSVPEDRKSATASGEQSCRRVSASTSHGGVLPVLLPTPKHICNANA